MSSRALIVVAVALGLLAVPPDAEAQQPRNVYRVGVLSGISASGLFEALRQGLHELGWSEGQNLLLEYRSADSRPERIPELAADLVRRKVDVIVVTGTAIYEAKQAIASVPTVFVTADDPVSEGLVASLARPGGRMTGLTSLNVELDAKRLEILTMALPGVRRVGVLSSPLDRTNRERIAAVERGARSLGLQISLLEVPSSDLLPGVFQAASRTRTGALMVLGSPLLYAHQARIAELARKTHLPVVSAWREFPDVGGLMSYGTNVPAMFRRAASYVDRILKGASPGELPVERAATFELVVNSKTARTLGLMIPPALLARADHVIE